MIITKAQKEHWYTYSKITRFLINWERVSTLIFIKSLEECGLKILTLNSIKNIKENFKN